MLLIKYQVTDASFWAASLCAREAAKGYDESWMIGWFANAIETTKDSVMIPDIKPDVIDAITKFPVGTLIESTIGEGGPSEVFIGDSGLLQPFSYLDDYDVDHYKIVKSDS